MTEIRAVFAVGVNHKLVIIEHTKITKKNKHIWKTFKNKSFDIDLDAKYPPGIYLGKLLVSGKNVKTYEPKIILGSKFVPEKDTWEILSNEKTENDSSCESTCDKSKQQVDTGKP